MRRRFSASRKLANARQRKAEVSKRRSAPAARDGSSDDGQETEVARLARERDEAREQQKATAEILRVIRTSPADVQPVFETIVRNAVSLCGSLYANVFRFDGELLHFVAFHIVGPSPAPRARVRRWKGQRHYEDLLKAKYPMRPDSSQVAGRVLLTKSVVRLEDALTDPDYDQRFARAIGFRRLLGVPMLCEGDPLGVIVVGWVEAGPIPKVQEELLKTFADQAVIAIENVRLFEAEQQRTRELTESLEQQTATSDVLKVISSSPGDLQPVFHAMLENATRLCEAKFGVLYRSEGDAFRVVALHGAPLAYVEERRRNPIVRPHPETPLGRAVATKRAVQIADVLKLPSYFDPPSGSTAPQLSKLAGARTVLAVPMCKDDELVGIISIYRLEVRPFTDKQVELVTNFAAQAVIAIENTRLLNELRESLQQQTATADVLKTISRSTFDLQTVLNTLVQSAAQLCRADRSAIRLAKDGLYYNVASHGFSPEHKARMEREAVNVDRGSIVGRVVLDAKSVHLADSQADPNPELVNRSKSGNTRTLLGVPLQREGTPIGVLLLQRTFVQPFTDKEIGLAETFADQAVIAIENVRLFEAEQQRTRELTESLEQQTATSEVLRVISSSQGELEPVFQAMLANATRICEAEYGMLWRTEGEGFRPVALHGVPPALAEMRQREQVFHLGPEIPLGRIAQTKRLEHIADATKELAYVNGLQPFREFVDVFGARTFVLVPMLKDTALVGVIAIYRKEVRPFTDKQIELVKNFAAQAVIAIENTRLLNELRQRTEELGSSVSELRALGEISQAVNSTLDLEAVLSTIVAKAVQLSGTEAGAIYVFDPLQREFHLRATYGMDQQLIEALTQRHIGLDDPNVAQALAQPEPFQVPDLRETASSAVNEIILRAGFRAVLVTPLMREQEIVGALVVRRRTPGEFPKNTVDLIKTFAAQSALAIQNARLFHEIEDKSRQLEEASQHKSQFLANMSHELRTPLNAILGYTELMADGAYGEPSEKMLGILKRLEANGKHLLGLINDVLDLSKIEAGQLVLELSDYCIQDIAQTVRSTLEPLAADKKLAFKLELGPGLPPGHGDGRRLTQVLINLVGNAIKFTDAGEVAIKAEANNGSFHVSVRDTGPGISAADQAKLFQEFQQADNAITRKKGGTGLGLAISKRIIEMHGGRIWVESQPGRGSTFAFTLPVIVERQVEAA
jgi:GAF domain-containing protein